MRSSYLRKRNEFVKMEDFKYTFIEDRYCVENGEDKYLVLDIGNECAHLVKRYKVMIAHKHDLEHAEACLNQMFYSECSSLIDNALINTAIQLLVRCFSNQAGKGRTNLDRNKVFRIFAKKIGKEDLTQLFDNFYNIRNKVISHDEYNFNDNCVGITVDIASGRAVDVTDIAVSTTFLYKENQEKLMKLILVAKEYADDQINNIREKLIEWYNENEDIKLIPLKRMGFIKYNSW